MFSKAKLFFVIDAVILVAFLASAISGLVLLTMPHGGYQGVRNPDFGKTVLYLSRDGWNDVHVWGSLAMIGGIFVHLALHWKWIVYMLKRSLGSWRSAGLPARSPVAAVVVTSQDG
ncbi:MAG: DUF4405 domain-containing protein [Anaerolineae bacterium]|nr:DUF4405 domain-containing protein [Anaerolineae bacterium]